MTHLSRPLVALLAGGTVNTAGGANFTIYNGGGTDAVNNAGTWGRWAFVEINDPWDVASQLPPFLPSAKGRT